jgi:formylglycine-generating enzyme required for sulfatase activity
MRLIVADVVAPAMGDDTPRMGCARALPFFLALVASPIVSCQLLFPVAAPPDDAGTAPVDAAPDTPDVAPLEDGGGCVRTASGCIDRTEVTQKQYDDFVAALDGGVPIQTSPYCAGRSAIPSAPCPWPPPETEYDRPVVCVDWCGAYAYCRWTGKHLCGHVDGGALDPYDKNSPLDEWWVACSPDGGRFPYGDTYDPAACNGGDLGAGSTWDAGSHPTCQGGYPGIFDMSGNVAEWIDSCDTTEGGTGVCSIRGGSFLDPGAGKLECQAERGPTGIGRYNIYSDVGFRCCSP